MFWRSVNEQIFKERAEYCSGQKAIHFFVGKTPSPTIIHRLHCFHSTSFVYKFSLFILFRSTRAYFAHRWPYEQIVAPWENNQVFPVCDDWYEPIIFPHLYRSTVSIFSVRFHRSTRARGFSMVPSLQERCYELLSIHSLICSLITRKVGEQRKRRNINTNMSMLRIVTLLLLLVCHQTVARVPLLRLDAAVLNENSNGNSESVHRLDAIVEEDAKSYAYIAWRFEFSFPLVSPHMWFLLGHLQFLPLPLGSIWSIKFL